MEKDIIEFCSLLCEKTPKTNNQKTELIETIYRKIIQKFKTIHPQDKTPIECLKLSELYPNNKLIYIVYKSWAINYCCSYILKNTLNNDRAEKLYPNEYFYYINDRASMILDQAFLYTGVDIDDLPLFARLGAKYLSKQRNKKSECILMCLKGVKKAIKSCTPDYKNISGGSSIGLTPHKNE